MSEIQDIFLQIKIEGENRNIGVVLIPHFANRKIAKHEFFEPKLIQALESHFDCPVKIVSSELNLDAVPCTAKAYVKIESDDQDFSENVELSQTWVY